ncbi:MAG TPA: three-Cys-motif partner protein TcmP, partial [Blastocatellia bacterium]|nr:three-Cys-motif partner protein TcmP [Blastocatellia bacterium]
NNPYLPNLELPEPEEPEPKVPAIHQPIWTKNKAKLIERYLLYFLYITKHGTYIDGFAGPQERDNPEMWAAKLVLDMEPKWLRHFHLFDKNKHQIRRLNELKKKQPDTDSNGKKIRRDINIYLGDFNVGVHELLSANSIGPKEATFCLLDQRTFECHWSTVKALAEYKPKGERKIELFYFLPIGWLDRAFAAIRNEKIIECWWGRQDWQILKGMSHEQRKEAFMRRFKTELGYKIVKPYPIFERARGGRTMYYMILATDHPDAPTQMSRAYDNAVKPKESHEQLSLMFLGNTDEASEI